MKKTTPSYYDKVIVWGAKPHDIVKFIKYPEKCGTWDFEYVCQVYEAIRKIARKSIVPLPTVEKQNEEDSVLSKLLRKTKNMVFGTSHFFGLEVTLQHVIEYMERDEKIYFWNGDFVIKVQ